MAPTSAASTGASRRDRSGGLRAIPSDHEAERAVLGAILLDHDAIHKVMDKLVPASFDLPRHRVVYETYLGLVEKQQAITSITLRSALEEHGKLEGIGGGRFIADLHDTVPTAAHIEHHAELVREKALARNLIRTCETLAARGYEGTDDTKMLVEDAERQILHVAMGHADTMFTTIRDELESTVEYIERVQDGQIVGVRAGFKDFDNVTGGLNGGDLAVLAARPSMGKTAFALNVARNHALKDNGCVGFFSLEMTKRELMVRMLLGEAQIDNQRFRNGMLSEKDWRDITRAATRLEEARIFFDDSAAVTVSDLSARARRLHRETQLSMIMIDYIQLVQGRDHSERREQQVADISRSLKLLAKDLDVPIVALSQLNRGPESRPDKRPQLGDLRESGAIEQDADLVMFIYRDEVYHEDSPDVGLAEIIIAKQRNGPIGTVKLQWEKQYGRFHDLAGHAPAPPESGFGQEPGPDTQGGLGLDSDLPFGEG